MMPNIAKVTVIADIMNEKEILSHEKLRIVRCWKLNSLTTGAKIVSKILRTKPDLVHFNLIFRHFSSNRIRNFLGLMSPSVTRLFGIPVILTLHSIAEAVELDKVGYSNSYINRIGYRLATKLLLKANIVTLTHPQLVKILQDEYNARNVTFVPHGVFFKPASECKYSGKTFLLFGKMGPYKNPSLAIEAFAKLVSEDKEAELIVAGASHPLHPGYLESILQKWGQVRNMKTCGYVEEEDIPSLFSSVIAVLLPYTISPWSSGVFTLASVYGRPVIAPDLPDFRELKAQGAGILLFSSGDSDALYENMKSLIGDHGLQENLGYANLKWAHDNQFERVVRELVEIFHSLSEKNSLQAAF